MPGVGAELTSTDIRLDGEFSYLAIALKFPFTACNLYGESSLQRLTVKRAVKLEKVLEG